MMLEEKRSETPYASFMNNMADDQCSFCRFNSKRKTWHCDRESIWAGENPCAKAQEYICPIAREDYFEI
jgi:hypothetical protein